MNAEQFLLSELSRRLDFCPTRITPLLSCVTHNRRAHQGILAFLGRGDHCGI